MGVVIFLDWRVGSPFSLAISPRAVGCGDCGRAPQRQLSVAEHGGACSQRTNMCFFQCKPSPLSIVQGLIV